MDLISENQNANTLTILTNNGVGIFGSNAVVNLSATQFCIAAADINYDVKIDLTIANANASSLTILTNDGSGKFGFNATINLAGLNPLWVVASDIYGDGKMELISADSDLSSAGTLAIFTINASGIYGLKTTLNVGIHPHCVVAVDVNSDKKLDLVSANFGNGVGVSALTVMTNNGNGGFSLKATTTIGTGKYTTFVAAADINGDGKMDLISVNPGDNTLTVFTNSGSAFGFNATINAGKNPEAISTADINGDGMSDLITANYGTNTLTVLTNDGSGIFGSNTLLQAGSGAVFVTAADLNGDGRLDLVCAKNNTNTLTVFANTSIFPAPTLTPLLAMKLQGTGIQVAWPSVSPGWSLKEIPDLLKTNWLPSGYNGFPITDDGTNKSQIRPYLNGSLFFRLLHP